MGYVLGSLLIEVEGPVDKAVISSLVLPLTFTSSLPLNFQGI